MTASLAALLLAAGPAAFGAVERVPIPATPLTAIIETPKAARGRLPALMIFAGFETGARSLEHVAPRRPAVLATFQYPGPRHVGLFSALLEARRLKRALADTETGLVALAAMLRHRRDVDPGRVCVVGVSFAAPLAIQAAADDSDISCLIVVEGFADVKGTAQARLRQELEPRLGPLAVPLSWAARAGVDYLAPPRPEDDAPRLRASQRVLLVEAAGEDIIPARSRELLRRALARSKARVDRVTVPGSHLRGPEDPRIAAIVALCERWLAGKGPRIPL